MTTRIGIIGGGFMGKTWSEVVTRYVPGAELVAISGGKRGVALAAEYDRPTEPNAEALLARADIDAVVIATPQPTHCDLTIKAARAGKHILVEKPMSMDVAEADRMVAAADAADVRLAVVSQHRFRASPRVAKRLIEEGAIGTIRMVQVRGVSTPWDVPVENEPYADLGFHLLDALRYLVGSEATSVSAHFASYGSTTPPRQSGLATYRFASDVLAHIWFSYELPEPGLGSLMHFLITGSEGMIDFDSYGAVRLARDGAWSTVHEQSPFDPNDLVNPVRAEAYANQFNDFLTGIAEHRDPWMNGREGRTTMTLIEGALRSDATGTVVRLA